MAFLIFADAAVDLAVLETGLGGRLDATNIVHPELCAITPIDFDHEAYLGRGLEAIAGEKAGILKRVVPAVFAAQRAEVEGVLERQAADLDLPVRRTREWPSLSLGASPRAAISLMMVAKAIAAMDGRGYLIPDDVKSVAAPVLRHRIMLKPEADLEGATADQIIRDVVAAVEVPK